jgi:uncharacterized protein
VKLFLDSSALVKLYVEEAHAERVQEHLANATQMGVSVLAIPEAISAFARRKRERLISPDQFNDLQTALLADMVDATIVSIDEHVLARVLAILERTPVKSADALHVACALEWQADLVLSADHQQCNSARASGLKVEELAGNPG